MPYARRLREASGCRADGLELEESIVLVVVAELVIHVKEVAEVLMVTMVMVARLAVAVVIVSSCSRGSICLWWQLL